MRCYSRRRLIVVTGAGMTGLAIGGCDDPAATRQMAIIAIQIGSGFANLPHPAMRLLSVVLRMSGMLVITYITLESISKTAHIKLTADQAEQLKVDGSITVVLGNRKTEKRAIDKVDYAG